MSDTTTLNNRHPLRRQDSDVSSEVSVTYPRNRWSLREIWYRIIRPTLRFWVAIEQMLLGLFRIWSIAALFISVYTISHWNLRDLTRFLADGEELSSSTMFRLTALSILNMNPQNSIVLEGEDNMEVNQAKDYVLDKSLRDKEASSSWTSLFHWSSTQKSVRTRLVHSSIANAFTSSSTLRESSISPVIFLNESQVCEGTKISFPSITTEQAKILLKDQERFRFISQKSFSPGQLQSVRSGRWTFLDSFFPTEDSILSSLSFANLGMGRPQNQTLLKHLQWIAVAPYSKCGYKTMVKNLEDAGFSGLMLYLEPKDYYTSMTVSHRIISSTDVASIPEEDFTTNVKDVYKQSASPKPRIFTALLTQHTASVLKRYFYERPYTFFLIETASSNLLPRLLSFSGLCQYLLHMFLIIVGGGVILLLTFATLLSIRNKVQDGHWEFLTIMESISFALTGTLFALLDMDPEAHLPKKPPTLETVPFPERKITSQDLEREQQKNQESGKSWEEREANSFFLCDKCAICLEDYIEGDVVRELPCKHVFHSSCVDEWLMTCQRVCPFCKQDVLGGEASPRSIGQDTEAGPTSISVRQEESTGIAAEVRRSFLVYLRERICRLWPRRQETTLPS